MEPWDKRMKNQTSSPARHVEQTKYSNLPLCVFVGVDVHGNPHCVKTRGGSARSCCVGQCGASCRRRRRFEPLPAITNRVKMKNRPRFSQGGAPCRRRRFGVLPPTNTNREQRKRGGRIFRNGYGRKLVFVHPSYVEEDRILIVMVACS